MSWIADNLGNPQGVREPSETLAVRHEQRWQALFGPDCVVDTVNELEALQARTLLRLSDPDITPEVERKTHHYLSLIERRLNQATAEPVEPPVSTDEIFADLMDACIDNEDDLPDGVWEAFDATRKMLARSALGR